MTAPNLPVYFDQSIRYTDFLSITLTALAVILAALGIIIGILAFVGYRQILNAGKLAAARAVKVEIREYFEGKEFRNVLAEVTTTVQGEGATVQFEFPAATKVAEEYPKREGE